MPPLWAGLRTGPVLNLQAATVPLVRPSEPVPVAELAPLAEACEAHELVFFNYNARGGAKTTRRAEPYRLVATTRLWYLVAFDLDRQDWRTFRVDRIKQVRLTGHTFAPRPLSDPGALVARAISASPYRYQALVRFGVPSDQLARRIPPNVGMVEPYGDGCLAKLGTDDIDWLASYLVGLALPFEIVEPASLRQEVRDLAERILSAHSPA